MRKPRDIDAELAALSERTRQLQRRKVAQLGELVIACGADALPVEELAGALLAIMATKDASTKEGWRAAGATFFQRTTRSSSGAAGGGRRAAAGDGRAQPAADDAGAA